jgi:hypothetical protein
MIVQFSIAARNEDSVAGHCKVGKIDANAPGFRTKCHLPGDWVANMAGQVTLNDTLK